MLVALLVLFSFYTLWILRTGFIDGGELHFTLVDDAMISMVYARNLAEGHGLVWSTGEPVEGFSNLLWTLILAAAHRIEPSEARVVIVVMFAGALVLLVLAGLAWRLAGLLHPRNHVAPAAAGAAVGLYFPVVFWTLRGLEVGFLSLLACAGAILTLELMDGLDRRRAWGLGAVLAAMLLTRFDTLITAAVLLGGLALWSDRRDKWSAVAPGVASVVATVAAVTVFRLLYFGQPLPNTFDLKLTGVSFAERLAVGLASLRTQALDDLWLPALVIVAGLLLASEPRSSKAVVLLALFGCQCLYSVYTGGDYAEMLVGGANRFVAQGVPFLLIVSVSTVEAAWRERLRRPILTGATAVLGSPLLAVAILLPVSGDEYRDWRRDGPPMFASDVWRARLGMLIHESTAPDAVIACHAAGNIVYFSRRPAVDLLGKSDRHVAHGAPAGPFRPGHNKWDYEYSILELRPDVVADDWGDVAAFIERQAPDYERLVNGVWVRVDSQKVDRALLSRPFE